MVRVLLGSNSKIKESAVSSAFGETLKELTCYSARSGVPEQPIGQDQTREGAFNRAIDAQRNVGKDYDLTIGIENGIWQITDDSWVDGACICILPRGWEGDLSSALAAVTDEDDCINTQQRIHPVFLWSDVIVVPPVEQRPFPVGPNGEWSALKDPHAVLTNGARPRGEFLRCALLPFVEKISTIST